MSERGCLIRCDMEIKLFNFKNRLIVAFVLFVAVFFQGGWSGAQDERMGITVSSAPAPSFPSSGSADKGAPNFFPFILGGGVVAGLIGGISVWFKMRKKKPTVCNEPAVVVARPVPPPATPPPVAPRPVPPSPVAPRPVTPPPVAPRPVIPPPVAPRPVTPPPVALRPVAPPPVALRPVAPLPVLVKPIQPPPEVMGATRPIQKSVVSSIPVAEVSSITIETKDEVEDDDLFLKHFDLLNKLKTKETP